MILIQIIFLAINIIMAWWHARLIKQDRPIKHGLWGGAYLVTAVVVAWGQWQLLILLLLIRKVFFDAALNLFRGKSLFYVSRKPASIIDKLHAKIEPEIYIGVYLALIVFLNLVRI